MKITLYSTHCPKCKVIEKKLEVKNLPYEEVDDMDSITSFCELHNIRELPLLDVDGEIMNFATANKWLNEQ